MSWVCLAGSKVTTLKYPFLQITILVFVMELPATYLGKWLLMVACISLFNSAQCYTNDLRLSQRIYSIKKTDVTPLSNRTFGTWTALAAVVRCYAAYHLNDPVVWKIALSSYLIAGSHFLSEWLIFKTAAMGKGLLSPLLVASFTTAWMILDKPL